jgi:hypothetical protein
MIKDSLGEDVAVYDYVKPGSDTQTFLVHYRQELQSFTFDPAEYSFTGTEQEENFDIKFEIPSFEEIRKGTTIECSITIDDEYEIPVDLPTFKITLPIHVETERQGLNDEIENLDPALKELRVEEGYIDLVPPTDFDLKDVIIILFEDSDDHEGTPFASPLKEPIDDPDKLYRYRYVLDNITVSKDMEVKLTGDVLATVSSDIDPDDFTIPFDVDVKPQIVSIAACVEVEPVEKAQSVDFELPQGVKKVTFDKIGADLAMIVNHPVEGVGLRIDMEFYAGDPDTPAFTLPIDPEEFNLMKNSDPSDPEDNKWFIGIGESDDPQSKTIPPPGFDGKLSDITSAKIRVTANPQVEDEDGNKVDRLIWVKGIGESGQITINANAKSAIDVESAVLDLNAFIEEKDRSATFPNEGEKGINFSDFTGSLGDSVDIDSLQFDEIKLHVYLTGLDDDPDTSDEQRLNIWDTRPGLHLEAIDRVPGAETGTTITNDAESGPLAGFEELGSGDRGIDFPAGDEFTGELPSATFNTARLTGVLNDKPKDLAINYGFKFGNDFTVQMGALEGEISKIIAVDILVELPLKMRLLAPDGKDYGALRYKSEETKDILNREPETDDPFSDYIKYLDFANLELNYENTLGLTGTSIVLLNKGSDNSIIETEKLVEGEGTINITLRGEQIPYPFIPEVEVRVRPLVPFVDGQQYGIIEVKRGIDGGPAGFNVRSIKVKAQTHIDEELKMSELL